MNEKCILQFLKKVDILFPTPLSLKTDLASYATKLSKYADIIFYNESEALLGAIAGYINNSKDEMAYVSFIAVLPEAQGKGVGTYLLQSFIAKAKEKSKIGVHLYAVKSNTNAVRMYMDNGFVDYKIDNEERPNDLHLVYWI